MPSAVGGGGGAYASTGSSVYSSLGSVDTTTTTAKPMDIATTTNDSTTATTTNPTTHKRKIRNAREKDRSSRISQEIDQLRTLLSTGGVSTKPTKNHVLTEAVHYIKSLQTRLSQGHAQRLQLLQHIQLINGGAEGVVPSIPLLQQGQQPQPQQQQQKASELKKSTIQNHDFKLIFESSSIPMVSCISICFILILFLFVLFITRSSSLFSFLFLGYCFVRWSFPRM